MHGMLKSIKQLLNLPVGSSAPVVQAQTVFPACFCLLVLLKRLETDLVIIYKRVSKYIKKINLNLASLEMSRNSKFQKN